jgi:hypothetical protein
MRINSTIWSTIRRNRRNVATKPGYSRRLEEMKRLLKRELTKFPDRPFGEFIPGGNAVGLEGQSELIPKLRKFAAAMK